MTRLQGIKIAVCVVASIASGASIAAGGTAGKLAGAGILGADLGWYAGLWSAKRH